MERKSRPPRPLTHDEIAVADEMTTLRETLQILAIALARMLGIESNRLRMWEAKRNPWDREVLRKAKPVLLEFTRASARAVKATFKSLPKSQLSGKQSVNSAMGRPKAGSTTGVRLFPIENLKN